MRNKNLLLSFAMILAGVSVQSSDVIILDEAYAAMKRIEELQKENAELRNANLHQEERCNDLSSKSNCLARQVGYLKKLKSGLIDREKEIECLRQELLDSNQRNLQSVNFSNQLTFKVKMLQKELRCNERFLEKKNADESQLRSELCKKLDRLREKLDTEKRSSIAFRSQREELEAQCQDLLEKSRAIEEEKNEKEKKHLLALQEYELQADTALKRFKEGFSALKIKEYQSQERLVSLQYQNVQMQKEMEGLKMELSYFKTSCDEQHDCEDLEKKQIASHELSLAEDLGSKNNPGLQDELMNMLESLEKEVEGIIYDYNDEMSSQGGGSRGQSEILESPENKDLSVPVDQQQQVSPSHKAPVVKCQNYSTSSFLMIISSLVGGILANKFINLIKNRR